MRRVALFAFLLTVSSQTIGAVLMEADMADGFEDRVPARLDGSDLWLGLYVGTDGSSALQTGVVEWVGTVEGGSTTYRPLVEPSGTILPLRGVGWLAPGAAHTVAQHVVLSSGSPSLELTLGSRTYTLRIRSTDATLCDAVVVLTDGAVLQSLYEVATSPFTCDEPHFTVHWAGDLDRDGRLDLITTFTSKYNVHPRTLRLSSGVVDPGQLVAPVARLTCRFLRSPRPTYWRLMRSRP